MLSLQMEIWRLIFQQLKVSKESVRSGPVARGGGALASADAVMRCSAPLLLVSVGVLLVGGVPSS